jgi:hypothetical protein
MGIFDEEAKKMAAEIAAAERRVAEQKAKHSPIARKVAEDLMSYIGTHPRLQGDIDIGVNENRIMLRKKTTSSTLEIVCTGELGSYFEVIVDGTNYGVTNESNMARGVLKWFATASERL